MLRLVKFILIFIIFLMLPVHITHASLLAGDYVLEINMSYDLSKSTQITLGSVNLKVVKKQPILPKGIKEQYIVRVLDENKVITETTFDLPSELPNDSFLDGDLIGKSPIITVSKGKTTVTLPYIGGNNVQILNSSGKVIAKKSFTSKETISNKISSLASFQNTYNLVVIGSNFPNTNNTSYNSFVALLKNDLLSTTPFKEYKDFISITVIQTPNNFNCKHDTTIDRLVVCDDSLVIQAVNNASIPYNKILVIVNSQAYGGSGGQIAVATLGLGTNQTIHELGHVIGGLSDEYEYGYESIYPVGVLTRSNCYNGPRPAPLWDGIVPSGSYFRGCSASNWYRSSQTSIMEAYGVSYFNPISIRILKDSMGLPDNPPQTSTPTITSFPTPTLTPTPSIAPTPKPTSTPTPSKTPTPSPTATKTPTPTLTPTLTPKPTLISTPTFTPVPTNTPTPTVTNTPTPLSTNTPTPQSTNTPTPSCILKNQGDANCDGVINPADFIIWKIEYLAFTNPQTTTNTIKADFNKDLKIDPADFVIWKLGYLNSNLQH